VFGPDFDLTNRIQLAKCRPKFCSLEWAIEHTDDSDYELLKKREALERRHSGRCSTTLDWMHEHDHVSRLVWPLRR
jgi:hypothetical protein